jgi:ferredoxin-NADP reductase/MOSC domain-containing protein YiiM
VAELLAVCVGLPEDIAWRGSTVRTAVWKGAVTGPRMVRRLNIDGDGQGDLAGHGGEQRAVLVYQIDSYRHWQRELGRDDFVYGQFGENFTVDGLADDEVCIGDRYQIGQASFEVTQPRVTCYRVGVRMNEPRMAAVMVSHGRPGFYLRVLTEGLVEAGDQIVKVASGPEAMTVAEINALLYLPGHPRRDATRALRIPALSPGWQSSMRELLEQPGEGSSAGNVGLNQVAASPPPAWGGFRPLRVVRKQAETPSVSSLWLADPDGDDLPAAQPGQYITVRLGPNSAAAPLIRSYSLSGRPGEHDYRISVKREPHGAASSYVHGQLDVGDTVDVAAPRGVFTLRSNDNPVLLISAGIGVTPVLAMLYSLAASHDGRQIWWLHGARSGAEDALASDARALMSVLPHGHSHIFFSQPGPEDEVGTSYETLGRLDGRLLSRLDIPHDADAYLCGPQAFMTDVGAALVALGFDSANIHTETFGTVAASTPGIVAANSGPPHAPAGEAGRGPAVSFARSGLTVNWDSTYADLLELAEACDVPVRWSCRTGVCHTCETPALSGSVTYAPDPVDAPGNGNILICCAAPETAVVLDL